MVTKQPSKEVQTIESGGVAVLSSGFLAELAKEAKDEAAKERPAVSKFGTRNGQLKYGGELVPGNNMDVIILAASYRNLWFGTAFNPDNIQNPKCFSLQMDDENMMPHPSVGDPPAKVCSACPKNAWKSDIKADGTIGKGKACKESRRLAMLPANCLVDGVDGVKTAEIGILDLPVTSAKNYGGFVNAVAATVGVPPWACVANIKVQPSKNQFEVVITPIRVVATEEIARALKARVDEAIRAVTEPYDETNSANAAVSAEQLARQEAADRKIS